MFTVIYSFKVKVGFEAQLEKSWQELTDLIYTYEGSLGSRLHKETEQSYIAYAQWPSREQWKTSGDNLPELSKSISQTMRESCLEIKTLYELDVIDDRLKDKTNSDQH